jgi:hypothetical protein
MKPSKILAIALISLVTVGAHAQVKNVLLEQHTGTWCGWCPDGNVKMDEVIDLHGDRVIGVKIHNGDAMEISEQSVIASFLGLTGYPTGSVDRKKFGGSVFLSRNDWMSSVESQMRQRAKAAVYCFYTLDREARIVRIQVMADIIERINSPLKFNAYIVEDNVTGVGHGYNQSNYLSGRPGFEDNPYYNQPSTIVGFHHMKVVRKMCGGAWGVALDIPESVRAGEFYSYQFESEIDDAWDIDEISFIGILQVDDGDNKEIINSAVAIEDVLLIDSDSPTLKVIPSASDFNNTYVLENATNSAQTYTITILTTGRTPADWSAEFTSGSTTLTASGTNTDTGQIVVPARSDAELQLTLKTGSTIGIGDAKMILEREGSSTVKRSRMISGITNEVENILLESGSDYSLQPYINNANHHDFLILEPSVYLSLANDLTNVKLIIWNKGAASFLSREEIDFIKRKRNVNQFICGDGVIGSLVDHDSLNHFGLEWIGWNLEAEGFNFSIQISGQQDDVITGNLGENIEGRLIHYYINMVRITDTANVFPIMHFQNDGFRQYRNDIYFVTAEDAIFGVRSTKNNDKTVLLGITPYVIFRESIRQNLINSTLGWFLGDAGGGPDGPDGVPDGADESLSEALDTNLSITTGGDANWFSQTDEWYNDYDAAQSGDITDNQESWLQTTVRGAGTLSFYWRASAEDNCDFLEFYIDSSLQESNDGSGWHNMTYEITGSGSHTLEWRYVKDGSRSKGDDCGWVDQVEWTPAP